MASFEHAGNTVLQWQDDIYLQKPLKVDDIKYWYEGDLEDASQRAHGGYKDIIENTSKQIGEDKLFYDVHTPIIYDKDGMREVLDTYKWWKKQFLVKTLYLRTIFRKLQTNIHMVIESYKDCKLHEKQTKEFRLNKIKDSLFFSTSPQAIDPEMIEIFETLYPNKSRYERD